MDTISFKNIHKNFFYLTVEKLSVMGLNLVFVLLLPLMLTYTDFSMFLVALAVTSLFWMLMDLGLNITIINKVSKKEDNLTQLINTIATIKIITSFIVFLLLITFAVIMKYPMP